MVAIGTNAKCPHRPLTSAIEAITGRHLLALSFTGFDPIHRQPKFAVMHNEVPMNGVVVCGGRCHASARMVEGAKR